MTAVPRLPTEKVQGGATLKVAQDASNPKSLRLQTKIIRSDSTSMQLAEWTEFKGAVDHDCAMIPTGQIQSGANHEVVMAHAIMLNTHWGYVHGG